MAEKSWHRTFDDPIELPGGDELRTLREAANYITERWKRSSSECCRDHRVVPR